MTERQRQYIGKLIQDLKIFSPDTLHLVRIYFPETGLYLPLLDLLFEMDQDERSQTSIPFARHLTRIKQLTVTYLQERLAAEEAHEADIDPWSAFSRRVDAPRQESYQRVSEHIHGVLATVQVAASSRGEPECLLALNEMEKLARALAGYLALLTEVDPSGQQRAILLFLEKELRPELGSLRAHLMKSEFSEAAEKVTRLKGVLKTVARELSTLS